MKKNFLISLFKTQIIFSFTISISLTSAVTWASNIKESIITLDSIMKSPQNKDIDHKLVKAIEIIDDMDETKKWAEIKKLIDMDKFIYSKYYDELIYLYSAHVTNTSGITEYDYIWSKMNPIQDSIHFFPIMLQRFYGQKKASQSNTAPSPSLKKELARTFELLELLPPETAIHGPAIEGNILFGYSVKEDFSNTPLPPKYSLKQYLESHVPLNGFSAFDDYISLLEESNKFFFNTERTEKLAELYQKRGDKEKAAQNYYELSVHFNKSGDNKKANELIKKAYKNNPIDNKIDNLKSEIELAILLKEKPVETKRAQESSIMVNKTKKVTKQTKDTSYKGMVAIPEGCFLMGSDNNAPNAEPDEKPSHEVCLNAFLMDRYEVTNEKYSKFLEANPGYHIPTNVDSTYNYWNSIEFQEKFRNKPVINISWQDAQNYCQSQGKRLPTEAEWEYAAKGGNSNFYYPWGNEKPQAGSANRSGANYKNAWQLGDGLDTVGTYDPNGYGLYDMAGNVWEWVYDYYLPQYYEESPKYNPVTHKNGKCCVVRGGSWFSKDASHLRTTNRFWIEDKPNKSLRSVGFRCVKGIYINEQSIRNTKDNAIIDDNMTRATELDKKAVELFKKGSINEAIDIWNEAKNLAILPELGQTAHAAVLNNLGFAYYKLYLKERDSENYTLAKTNLEDSLISAPRWTAYLNLADLYFEGNEHEKALSYFEMLLEIKPNYKYAKKIHEKIDSIRKKL